MPEPPSFPLIDLLETAVEIHMEDEVYKYEPLAARHIRLLSIANIDSKPECSLHHYSMQDNIMLYHTHGGLIAIHRLSAAMAKSFTLRPICTKLSDNYFFIRAVLEKASPFHGSLAGRSIFGNGLSGLTRSVSTSRILKSLASRCLS